MDRTKQGIIDKFRVFRTDGTDAPGCKHDGCWYWVLDLTHDEFAGEAILAYADACKDKYPQLADELRRRVVEASA